MRHCWLSDVTVTSFPVVCVVMSFHYLTPNELCHTQTLNFNCYFEPNCRSSPLINYSCKGRSLMPCHGFLSPVNISLSIWLHRSQGAYTCCVLNSISMTESDWLADVQGATGGKTQREEDQISGGESRVTMTWLLSFPVSPLRGLACSTSVFGQAKRQEINVTTRSSCAKHFSLHSGETKVILF